MNILDRMRAARPERIELADLITSAGPAADGTYRIALTVTSAEEEYAILDNVDDFAALLPEDGYTIQVDGAITYSAIITPVPGTTEEHVVRIPTQNRVITAPTLECGLSHVFGIVT